MRLGEYVKVIALPAGLAETESDDLNTRRVFKLCVGRTFPIMGFENGLIELHVGEVTCEEPLMQSIWIEPECVEAIF